MAWSMDGDCDSDFIFHSVVRVAEIDDPNDSTRLYTVIFDHMPPRGLDDDIMTFIHRPMHPSALPVLALSSLEHNAGAAPRETISIDLIPCRTGGLHSLHVEVDGNNVTPIETSRGGWSQVVLRAKSGLNFVKLWNTVCDVWEYVPVMKSHDRHVVMRMEPRSHIDSDSAVNFVQAPNALVGTLPNLPGLDVKLCREDDDKVCTDAVIDDGAYYVTYALPQYRYNLVLRGDNWSRTIGLVDLQTPRYRPRWESRTRRALSGRPSGRRRTRLWGQEGPREDDPRTTLPRPRCRAWVRPGLALDLR
jgi:hypothetical protein